MNDPLLWMAILIILGAGLLFAEIFVPGMVLGIVGCLCLLASVVIVNLQYGLGYGLLYLALLIALGILAFIGWVRLLPQTKIGQRLILNPEGLTAQPYTKNPDLVGRRGVALTDLRPAGTAEFDGKRVDVIAESGMIKAKMPVEVIAVEGVKVTVRPAK